MHIPLYFCGHIYLYLVLLQRVARLLLVADHLCFWPRLNCSLLCYLLREFCPSANIVPVLGHGVLCRRCAWSVRWPTALSRQADYCRSLPTHSPCTLAATTAHLRCGTCSRPMGVVCLCGLQPASDSAHCNQPCRCTLGLLPLPVSCACATQILGMLFLCRIFDACVLWHCWDMGRHFFSCAVSGFRSSIWVHMFRYVSCIALFREISANVHSCPSTLAKHSYGFCASGPPSVCLQSRGLLDWIQIILLCILLELSPA